MRESARAACRRTRGPATAPPARPPRTSRFHSRRVNPDMAGRYIMSPRNGGIMSDKNSSGVTRREFIEKTAATGAAIAIVARHVRGRGDTAPSDLLNIASVGIGEMGHNNLRAVSSQNIVAVCGEDWDYAGKS